MSRRLPATGEDCSGSSPSASWWDPQPRFCLFKWGTESLQCRRRPTRRCRFLRDRRTMLAALPRPERPCAAPRVAALPVSRHASPHFRYLAQLCLVSFVSVSRHHGGRCIGARSSPQARWGTFTLGSTPPTPGDAAAGSAGGPPRDRQTPPIRVPPRHTPPPSPSVSLSAGAAPGRGSSRRGSVGGGGATRTDTRRGRRGTHRVANGVGGPRPDVAGAHASDAAR